MAIVSGSPVAISTRDTFLSWRNAGDTGDYTQVVDIASFGDLMGSPNLIDVTTLSHHRIVQILGLLTGDAIDFAVNYTAEHYSRCLPYVNVPLEFELTFQDGSGFTWEGELNMPVSGGGVDEAIEFTLSVSVTSNMDWFDAPPTP